MLTIPNSIITLFKTDGVRKNFRVHFPNGELNDITNANIVTESLHFTESLCSQDVFRFGLAEASVLEFETVDIANMYGMTIEAGIEIDTSSLSAAEITTIQAGTWDGTLVLAQDSDIGYGYFRVPLGIFRVESCPRNHGAMTHRKVTAYTQGITDYEIMSPFEVWKQEAWLPFDSMRYPSFEVLMDANFGWYDPTIFDTGYTKTAMSLSAGGVIPLDIHGTIKPAPGVSIGLRASASQFTGMKNLLITNLGSLYAVEYDDFDNSAALAWIASFLESKGLTPYREQVEEFLAQALFPCVFPAIGPTVPGYTIKTDAPAMYFPSTAGNAYVQVCTKVSLELTYGATTVSQTFTLSAGSPIKVTRIRKDDTSNDHAASFSPSGTMDSGGTTYYSYAGSYSYRELFESWLELHGQFATEGRTGTIRRVTLDPTTPTAVVPGDYSEAWWDEYDVAPIGTVTVTYQAPGGGEATEQTIIGNGASVYDMQDNEVLKCLDVSSVDDITDILTGDFATNAANVGFTPIDMSMQGWPWIEAGDALEITAEDGTVVDTYALRIEMSGIQNLQAAITATGGTIIGEA